MVRFAPSRQRAQADEGLTDEERDEMDELRCKMVIAALTLPPEKLEELIIRMRYVIDGHNDLPETLKSKFSQ
jgi:hypothetical protein